MRVGGGVSGKIGISLLLTVSFDLKNCSSLGVGITG